MLTNRPRPSLHHRHRHELHNNSMMTYELSVSENIESDSSEREAQEAGMFAFIRQATQEVLSNTTMEVYN